MENGRGHGSHRRQPDSEPVFCTPGSRLTGYGRGSAVARQNESISDRPTRSSESISDRPTRSSILGSSSTVLESSTSLPSTGPANSRFSDPPPVGSHSKPRNAPTLEPSREIVKKPYVLGSYNRHGSQLPVQQQKPSTVPIDPSLIEAALNNPHIQQLILPVTKEQILPVTKELVVPVTKELVVPVTQGQTLPVTQGQILPVTGNPFETADTQELVKRIVTIKNEMNKVSRDVPGLEALIKKTSKEIQCKSNLFNSLISAKELIHVRLNRLKEQEDHIFKQLCKDQTVRPPEDLLSKPSSADSTHSALGTLSTGSPSLPGSTPSSSLPGSSAATVESSTGSCASAVRVPSPASSSSSDSSAPTTTRSNGRKNVSQSPLHKPVRVGMKRSCDIPSADTSTGITSGVKTSTPIRIGKRRKENSTSDGLGAPVPDPQSVLAAVIRPASTVRASSSGTTSVKREPMGTESLAAGSVQTTMIVPDTASEAESESPAETVPAVNRSAAEPEAETVTNQADSLLIFPAAETSANSLPVQSTYETSTVPRTPDPVAAKSVAPTAAAPKCKIFPLKSTNVQDPVPFKVKPEPANHYPGEELRLQVTNSMPSFTPRLPSPPEEDEGSGILSMLSKSNQL